MVLFWHNHFSTEMNAVGDARFAYKNNAMLLKMATLPSVKTLEQYDFKFASGAPRAQLQELAGLAFVERAENQILVTLSLLLMMMSICTFAS